MERSHGGEPSRGPEQRENLHINSIVIPADEGQPLRQAELAAKSLSDRQQLVGGLIEGIDLTDPAARLYCNEEGKLQELPMNKRATLLLWAHNLAFRYRDIIVGDAFVVGPLGKRGADTEVPEQYISRLFRAHRFRIEVRRTAGAEWHEHPERFDEWSIAYETALGLGAGLGDRQRQAVADVRVVPEL